MTGSPPARLRAAVLSAALAASSLALGGCGLIDFGGQPAEPDMPGPVAAPSPHPAPAARPAVAPASRNARVLPLPPPPAPGRGPEIRLVGLSRSETQALLGPPAVESERSPAKVWQYHQGDCSVDVYFYLDVARNEFYALHYETRAPLATAAGGGVSPGSSSAEWCVQRVHDANRPR